MTLHRNPFRIRASQTAVSDEEFLLFFSSGVLGMLPKENEDLWSKLTVFRSAAGGGKTSLFRVFTPGVLNVAHSLKRHDNVKETINNLRALNALDESGPTRLGILLEVGKDYATLASTLERTNDFTAIIALLNARLVLATLRAVTTVMRLPYPAGLEHISISSADQDSSDIPSEGSALDAQDWASDIETRVLNCLDSLGPPDTRTLRGHADLVALDWIREAKFLGPDGQCAPTARLVMLDDLQNLTASQRRTVLDVLLNYRKPLGLWVSERLQALDSSSLLTAGVQAGRDYADVIHLEEKWRHQFRGQFRKFASDIAQLRASKAIGFEGRDLNAYIEDGLVGANWDRRFREAESRIRNRLHDRVGSHPRYQNWLLELEGPHGSAWESALNARMLEVLMERDLGKPQHSFDFDEALPVELIDERQDSAVRSVAEFFLATEEKFPILYGLDQLSAVASANVEQFVALAGDIFEEIISSVVISGQEATARLSAERQEEILRKSINARWKALPRNTPNGYQAVRLLEAVGTYCYAQTFRPNAPYAPGVTGIAISMADSERLVRARNEQPSSELGILAATLGACVAHNWFEVQFDGKQGYKNWLKLYLNRMLCVQFGLPLGYGGWREQSLGELARWVERGKSAIAGRVR